MKKNLVQDVVPPKKSIRNVKIPSRSTSRRENTVEERDEPMRFNTKPAVSSTRGQEDDFTRPVSIKKPISSPRMEPRIETSVQTFKKPVEAEPLSYKYEYDTPKRSSKKIVYISIFTLLLAGAFGISALFKSAYIKISPKEEVRELHETFRATKDATGASLAYQVVSATKDLEKTVTATGEEKVEKKATGKIVIYNDTTQVQKLVATTRFETPEGLIFRLISPVSVPAKTTNAGKSVSGSIEAQVEADKPGDSYNIGLKDFTIPGFKGDAKFKTVYARSKTEMTGGFSGMQKVVSKEVMAQAETEMENSLKEALSKDIVTQIPSSFILYPESLSYKFEPAIQVNSTTGTAVLRKKATTSGIILDRAALSRAILSKVAPTESDNIVKVTNLEALQFSFSSSSLSEASSLNVTNFSLTGNPDLVWTFDENKLKGDLLGLSKTDAKTVIGSYNTIKEAWIETSPFWNQTIPKNIEKVTLENTFKSSKE